jgi:hypothetical protein
LHQFSKTAVLSGSLSLTRFRSVLRAAWDHLDEYYAGCSAPI